MSCFSLLLVAIKGVSSNHLPSKQNLSIKGKCHFLTERKSMYVILFLPRMEVLKVKVCCLETVYCLCYMADAEMDLRSQLLKSMVT